MSSKQRVLFVQLQIASVGILLGIFGLMWKMNWLLVFGGCILVYGLVRYVLIARILKQSEKLSAKEMEELDGKDPLMQFGQNGYEESDEKGEYPMDEWEARLEKHFLAKGRQAQTIEKLEAIAPSLPKPARKSETAARNKQPADKKEPL